MKPVTAKRCLLANLKIGATLLMVACCSPGADGSQRGESATAAGSYLAFETYYTWFAANGAEVSAFDGDSELKLIKGGMAAAVYENMPVFPGDIVAATVQVEGKKGDRLMIILQRHCDSDNGADATIETLVLSGVQQSVRLEHNFGDFYSCWRLSFATQSETAIKVRASDLKFSAAP